MSLALLHHISRPFLFAAAALMALTASAQTQKPTESEIPSIEGRWYSYYGILDVQQSGADVEATYSCCRGKIRGTFTGNRLEFSWNDAVYGEGWGHFWVEGNGNRLEGMWGNQGEMDESGQWGALRMDEPATDGHLERFRLEHDHSRFGPLIDGEAIMAIHGDVIDGRLVGHYLTEFQGKPYRVDMFLYLDGKRAGDTWELEWEDPRYGHYGPIRLQTAGESAGMSGEWEPFGAAATTSVIHFKPHQVTEHDV